MSCLVDTYVKLIFIEIFSFFLLNKTKLVARKVFVARKYDQIMDCGLNRIRIDRFYLDIHFENHAHTLIYDKLVFENQPNHSKQIDVH